MSHIIFGTSELEKGWWIYEEMRLYHRIYIKAVVDKR